MGFNSAFKGLTFVNCWTANWKTRRTAEIESKYKVTIAGGIY